MNNIKSENAKLINGVELKKQTPDLFMESGVRDGINRSAS